MRKSASTKSDIRTQSAKVYKTSKVQERPSYKELPKFTHANMAVIHPAPKTVALRPSVSQPSFDVQADQIKFKAKMKVESKLKVLPDHLIRAPQPKNKKPSASASQKQLLLNSQRGKRMTAKEKKQLQDKAAQIELE